MKRRHLLNILIDRYSYTSYLELGCRQDVTFNSIDLTDKIGVDVEMGGTVRSTTDDFFSSCHRKFDLIFIDAFHEQSYVRRDFNNALEHLNDNGCIVMHDCLPIEENEQTKCPTNGSMWLGDGWKVVVEIRQRDDVDTVVVDSDHGMAIIFKQPNTAKLTEVPELNWENYVLYRDKLLRVIKINDLINLLPAITNPKNVWISAIPEWGRIGHQFNDTLAGPIIAEMFGFNYHYTGFVSQDNLNYYLNFADMFGKNENENPVLEIHTASNDAKWAGMSFAFLRKMMRSIPNDVNIVLRYSTYFNLRNLYKSEQVFDSLPGLYVRQIQQWRALIKKTNLYQEVTSDFTSKPGILNVATYVRGGGSLHDNAGRFVSKDAYDLVINQIQQDYPDHKLNINYYSQGPYNDLVGFPYEQIKICDNTYPRMYEVMKSLITADVFIAGLSGFSTMISILRDGPNYFLDTNPFVLPIFSRTVQTK